MRLAALPLLFAPLLAQAASLSVCTEASPEGFDVVQYNSLTFVIPAGFSGTWEVLEACRKVYVIFEQAK